MTLMPRRLPRVGQVSYVMRIGTLSSSCPFFILIHSRSSHIYFTAPGYIDRLIMLYIKYLPMYSRDAACSSNV